jgi:hypothetical protein
MTINAAVQEVSQSHRPKHKDKYIVLCSIKWIGKIHNRLGFDLFEASWGLIS